MKIDIKKTETRHKELICMAQDYMSQVKEGLHGEGHVDDVVQNVVALIELLPENTDINADVCVVSAYWHDVGRTVADKGHAIFSADMVREDFAEKGCDSAFIDACYDAIAHHTWGEIPPTLEGKLIQDADKLAFVGLNRWNAAVDDELLKLLLRVRNEFLNLDISRELWDIRVLELIKFLHGKAYVVDEIKTETWAWGNYYVLKEKNQ